MFIFLKINKDHAKKSMYQKKKQFAYINKRNQLFKISILIFLYFNGSLKDYRNFFHSHNFYFDRGTLELDLQINFFVYTITVFPMYLIRSKFLCRLYLTFSKCSMSDLNTTFYTKSFCFQVKLSFQITL